MGGGRGEESSYCVLPPCLGERRGIPSIHHLDSGMGIFFLELHVSGPGGVKKCRKWRQQQHIPPLRLCSPLFV